MQVDAEVIGSEGVSVGTLLRDWRSRRRLSQMELALDIGISPRHLSFVETGRSRPSADLLVTLAARLEVPLRERNRMLLSSGYAPRYSHRPLQARDMQPVRAALQRLLELHQPYPSADCAPRETPARPRAVAPHSIERLSMSSPSFSALRHCEQDHFPKSRWVPRTAFPCTPAWRRRALRLLEPTRRPCPRTLSRASPWPTAQCRQTPSRHCPVR